MYAIVETAGKQLRIEPGQMLKVDGLSSEVGTVVTLDRVLMLSTEEKTLIGSPVVESAKVLAEVKSHSVSTKTLVFKKKRRKNYRRTVGHRQPITFLEVKEIVS